MVKKKIIFCPKVLLEFFPLNHIIDLKEFHHQELEKFHHNLKIKLRHCDKVIHHDAITTATGTIFHLHRRNIFATISGDFE